MRNFTEDSSGVRFGSNSGLSSAVIVKPWSMYRACFCGSAPPALRPRPPPRRPAAPRRSPACCCTGWGRYHQSGSSSLKSISCCCGLEAVVDQPEQHPQGVVDEVAVLGGLGGQRHLLQVTQRLQGVALPVLVRLHRQDADLLAPGLGVEEEQQPVEVGQRLDGELAGQVVVPEQRLLGHGPLVVDVLVGQQFHRPAQAVLQVAGDGEGVLVRVVVQRVVQDRAVVGAEGVPGEQRRRGLEGVGLLAAEDLVDVEEQVLALAPLVPLDQEDQAAGQQDHPPGRLLPPEDQRQQVFPDLEGELVAVPEGPGLRPLLLGQALLERLVVLVGPGRLDEPEVGVAVPHQGGQHGHGQVVLDQLVLVRPGRGSPGPRPA